MIQVLYLEDEQKNPEIEHFCRVASEHDVEIRMVKDKEELLAELEDVSKTYPVVICDVELWDDADRNHKDRTLICLGFSCIKELIESRHELSHQYYLLSNCSKRLHGIFHRELKTKIKIKSKDDVFSEAGLVQFIQEIREEGNRVLESLKDTGIGHEVFDALYQYLQNNYIEGFGTFDEIEEEVTRRALALINRHKELIEKHKPSIDNTRYAGAKTTIQENMITEIRGFFEFFRYERPTWISNEKYPKIVDKDHDNTIFYHQDFLYYPFSGKMKIEETRKPVSNKTVNKFITRMILRRLAVYINKNKLYPLLKMIDVQSCFSENNNTFLNKELFFTDARRYPTTLAEKKFFKIYFPEMAL